MLSTKFLNAQWKPSSHYSFKINFDAALYRSQQITRVGVIIQDGRGLPIAALCKQFQCLYTINDAEAIAAREAVTFAREIGILDAEVEGDSLTICNALKNWDSVFVSIGDIIDEAHLLAGAFQQISFSHVKRDDNCTIHMLARRALDLQEDFLVWRIF